MKPERLLVCEPIGCVRSGRQPAGAGSDWERETAELEVFAPWDQGLEGIEGYSHLWIVWWLDRFGGPPPPTIHPEGRKEIAAVGLFATRSPRRPNPLGLTAVELVSRDGARLRVRGLDAYEGTPVLDIKPYLRRGDLWPEARMPAWLEELWQVHDREREG